MNITSLDQMIHDTVAKYLKKPIDCSWQLENEYDCSGRHEFP